MACITAKHKVEAKYGPLSDTDSQTINIDNMLRYMLINRGYPTMSMDMDKEPGSLAITGCCFIDNHYGGR